MNEIFKNKFNKKHITYSFENYKTLLKETEEALNKRHLIFMGWKT